MALSDENGGTGMVMPVQPMGNGYGYNYGGFGMPYAVPVMGGYNGGGFGGFGGDWGALIILFLFASMFGGFGGGFGGMGGFGGGMFPWLLASNANGQNATQEGFNQAATAGQLSGISSAITTGFSNAEVAACNRAMDAMQTAYNGQIADLNRSFAAQTALDSRLNGLDMSLQKCCCDNQLATEGLRATVLQENCQDRYEAQRNANDIINAQTAGFQRILDKMCDQELQAERRENDQLRTQLNMANLAASQAAQTAQLISDNTAQTQYIVNRVAPYPIPAYPVSNPYGCGGNWGWNYGFNNFGGNPFGNVGFGNGSF